MAFLNETRLKVYPRLFLIALWGVMLVNVAFHRGWVGRFGGIIGVDFMCLYGSGLIYRADISQLYNIEAHAVLQQALVSPTPLNGTVNIFPYPPYSAMAFTLFSLLPLADAYAVYVIFLFLFAMIAVVLIHRYILPAEVTKNLTILQLSIVIFSSLPFLLCIFFGQNSNLTLLLMTLIVIACLKEKWLYAGFFAGLLLYKPHFALGFVILWLAWKRWDALASFSALALAWIAGVVLQHGWAPFQAYLSALPQFMDFPYVPGLKLGVTPYAFFLTLIPPAYTQIVKLGYTVAMIGLCLYLAWAAYTAKPLSAVHRTSVLALASIAPFLISPNILIYDLVLWVVPLALWARLNPSRKLLWLVTFTYLGALILPALTRLMPLHLLAIIPLTLAAFFLRELPGWRTLSPGQVSEAA